MKNDRHAALATAASRRDTEEGPAFGPPPTGLPVPDAVTCGFCPEPERRQTKREAQFEEPLRGAARDAEVMERAGRYDFAPVGFFTVDREGSIGSANLAGASFLGVERGRLIGRPFALFLCEESRPALAELLARIAASRDKGTCEVRLPGRGGAQFARIEGAACGSGREFHLALLDLTESRRAQEALAHSETRYRRLFEAAKDGILILEAESALITDANPSFSELLGYSAEELRGRELWEIGIFPDAAACRAALEEMRSRGDIRYESLPLTAKDGRQLVVDFIGNIYQVDQNRVIQCDIRDITSRKQAEAALLNSEEQCRTIVNNINEYVYSVRFANGEINSVYHSPKCFDITGYSPEDYYRDPLLWFHMIHDDDRGLVTDFLNLILSGQEHQPIRHRIKHKDGSERWLLNNCAVQRIEQDGADAISRLDGFILDITDLKLAEENIFFLAHHDPLTRLPNRSTLYARIDQVISVAQKANRSVALLFLDIDGFKQVNDSLGHDSGDRLLQSVAKRLTECTRACDIVSRLGGDEFVIVLWDCGVDETTIVAEKIITAGFGIEGSTATVNSSIGISLYPENGSDYLTLLKNADLAMYHAKKAGGKGFHFFTPRLNEMAHERFNIESELRRALDNEEFVLHYQPKVNILTGKFSGMEALIRWQHPERGLLAPDTFIGIAEESGLLTPISKWIIGVVCRQIRAWREQGIVEVSAAINLSASFFQHADFEETIERALEETRVPPECLELELTEATLMNDPRRVLGSMAAMKALGLQLSIDDFGIGYSSLSYLKKLPVDKLKIDQSFIRNIANDPDNMAVVRAVINIGRSMQLKVIAEGVENASQLAWLQAEGGEEAQGYLFSRPLPVKGMTALLKAGANFLSGPRTAPGTRKWH
jgi:diguanylate cyclase (GGDEF)-like protein/PAS domain S-box-containing protein